MGRVGVMRYVRVAPIHYSYTKYLVDSVTNRVWRHGRRLADQLQIMEWWPLTVMWATCCLALCAPVPLPH